MARAAGVGEDIAVRLERIHSPLDPTGFRLRQLGWAVFGFGAGAILAALVGQQAPVVALLFLLGGPVLAFLIVEQQLSTASARWQRRIFLELPVVSEQLGMLLGAGYSLGAALNRVAAARSRAPSPQIWRSSRDASAKASLRSTLCASGRRSPAVEPLHRLVGLLALNREAGDLGRLIGEEARSIRREVQRELLEQIERRSQQVWIPGHRGHPRARRDRARHPLLRRPSTVLVHLSKGAP